ncbi:MAG: hypothetical protein KME08_17615 [Aphanothece sp. CMT-3BRIN-NPC111]|jgi:uncharacterized membrane protein YvlD (DUF360 family)|nr:hypothetical protein [Aphanothece sp. CMT-3BRIN-NPC111]
MVWRGSTTFQDRFLACLPYLVPLLEVVGFGVFLFGLIPPLKILFLPLFLLLPIYFFSIGGFALVEFAIFFALFLGVVRNETLSRFLRFNTMQALLLAIFVYLCSAFMQLFNYSRPLLFPEFAAGTDGLAGLITAGAPLLIVGIIFSAIFLVIVGASVYAVVQSLRGQYAEIPLISEAARSQV